MCSPTQTGLAATAELLNIPVNSFRKKEVELLGYVQNREMVNISLLPTEKEIRSLLAKDKNLQPYEDSILLGYRKKVSLLSKFQQGEPVYSYGYKP